MSIALMIITIDSCLVSYVLKKLTHPNIITVHDIMINSNRAYVFTEPSGGFDLLETSHIIPSSVTTGQWR